MVPRDLPVAVAAGPDPDKVLLVGSGPVAGVGVASHQEALTGALARQLVAHSRRGAVVESVGRVNLRLADIPHLLATTRLEGYDAVVVTAGMAEAVAMTPRRTWARSLDAVIEAVHARQSRGGTMLVTGMPTPTSTAGVEGWRGRVIDRHASLLNRTSRATVAAREYGHFTQLAPGTHRDGRPTTDCYTGWAGQICAVLEPLLSRGSGSTAT